MLGANEWRKRRQDVLDRESCERVTAAIDQLETQIEEGGNGNHFDLRTSKEVDAVGDFMAEHGFDVRISTYHNGYVIRPFFQWKVRSSWDDKGMVQKHPDIVKHLVYSDRCVADGELVLRWSDDDEEWEGSQKEPSEQITFKGEVIQFGDFMDFPDTDEDE